MFSTKETANGKERIKSALGHLEEGSRRVKKDVRDTAGKVHGDLDSLAESVGEQVREFVESTGEKLLHAKDSLSDASDTVATSIRGRPWPSVLVSLGVGIALGALLRRSR